MNCQQNCNKLKKSQNYVELGFVFKLNWKKLEGVHEKLGSVGLVETNNFFYA